MIPPFPTPDSVTIFVRERAGLSRADEPVAASIPWPAGRIDSSSAWSLADGSGRTVQSQMRVLACWPDGSVKWLQCIFQATVTAGETATYRLSLSPPNATTAAPATAPTVHVENLPRRLVVATTTCRFEVDRGGSGLLAAVSCGRRNRLGLAGTRLSCRDGRGKVHTAHIERIAVVENGPVRAKLVLEGKFGKKIELCFRATLSFYAASGAVCIALTLHNPARARHAGGYWDLGDSGSILFRDLTLAIHSIAAAGKRVVRWTEGPLSESREMDQQQFEIYQDSSGGENWRSRNHVNRYDAIPLQFRGYRVRGDGEDRFGLRASPTVCLQTPVGSLGCSPIEFWQKFPSALRIEGDSLLWQPFPPQFGDLHELQGGERSTHTAWLDFADADPDHCRNLGWTHAPLEVRCSSQWYADSGAIAHLPGPDVPLRPELGTMLHEALDGPRNFLKKREVVDEYGWRHFGDVWADHEEAYYLGPHDPIMSHFNNQFDLLHGMLVEYLRSGDPRWWELADSLARHCIDIDIYHTRHDRTVYNAGQFWPTNHYYDAGTSTHRSMAQAMQKTGTTGTGGGPGSEHNFANGLLLYYHLTGEESARECAIGLADWVVAMDDGETHVLGLLSAARTGFATMTADYHGPGRAAGNSLHALLGGWLTTGDSRYFDKAEEIVRRTIHPLDDVAAHDLSNGELRWSYTMYLAALCRFHVLAQAAGRSEFIIEYVRQSLLHYARWMVANERCYLDEPEKLEFATETWAAQDLRKGTVLMMIAPLAKPDEQPAFRQQAHQILDRAWEQLLTFPKRNYTRPMALMLQEGYVEAQLAGAPDSGSQVVFSGNHFDPGTHAAFVAQREDIQRSMHSPRGIARMLGRVTSASGWKAVWKAVLRRSWVIQRVFRAFGAIRY